MTCSILACLLIILKKQSNDTGYRDYVSNSTKFHQKFWFPIWTIWRILQETIQSSVKRNNIKGYQKRLIYITLQIERSFILTHKKVAVFKSLTKTENIKLQSQLPPNNRITWLSHFKGSGTGSRNIWSEREFIKRDKEFLRKIGT